MNRYGRMTFLNGQTVYGYDVGPSSKRRDAKNRVLIRTHLLWLAWYPLRGLRCSLFIQNVRDPWDSWKDGWHVSVAFGPAYLGLGPGVPSP